MKQKEALDILKMGNNVFLTGPAGSGKTHVLNEYVSFLKKRGVAVGVTASTGIAATYMDGITIHSWAGIGIKDELAKKDLEKLKKKKYIRDRLKDAQVLIIDEVSMLHHFRLDLVDEVCKGIREDSRPFGGMQIVLCGDFFQLPPIERGAGKAQFVYESESWNKMNLKVCYLNEQHRHEDNTLLNVLSDIRTDNVTDDTLVPLRERYQKEIPGDVVPTKLYTHNRDVDAVNNRELGLIDGEEKIFEMFGTGNANLVEILRKGCLAPEILRLKKGAAVMFVKNNFDEGYVNGTLGTVADFDAEGNPIVKTANGKTITAHSTSWVIEEDEVLAEISQIPLRLAWAITVHKSQGMSLDAAEIDLSKSFTHGMGYVALSRVRSLSGLKLMGFNKVAAQVNQEVLEHDLILKESSDATVQELEDLDKEEIHKKQQKFYKKIAPKTKEKKLTTIEKTRALILEKKPLSEIVAARKLTMGTVLDHIEKLVAKDKTLDISHLKPPMSKLSKIIIAFKKSGDDKLSPVMNILGKGYTFEELRLARLFLKEY